MTPEDLAHILEGDQESAQTGRGTSGSRGAP